jgi:diguanylate cyclase (GGDEF)-like protein
MKRLFHIFAIILGCASAAWAAAPDPLTTLRAVHALTNAEASRGVPVAFEATVSYSRGYARVLFVQDADAAIFVRPSTTVQLAPGDRVQVRGTTSQSFRPIVNAESVTLLRHESAPKPVAATFDELIRAQLDSLPVTVHSVIRAADMVVSADGKVRSMRLQMLTDGGHIEADVDSDDASALQDLLGAEVDVTGVAAGKFDDKMQQTGVLLYVSSLADIHVLHRAGSSPWSLPVTPMDRILADYHMRDLTPRVRVQGTITYYEPGSAIVLQDGPKSLWIETHTREPLKIGDLADATGYPQARYRFLTLTDGEVHDSQILKPVTPQAATWRQLSFWSANMPDGHQNDLVSIEGQVVTEVREASQDEYVVTSDGRLFTAIYRHPSSPSSLPPMMQIDPGSKIRVSGICVLVQDDVVDPGQEVPFNILLRSFGDISVISNPPLLNIRNLILCVGLLLVAVVAVGGRDWAIERKVRRQTGELAYIERRRSRILEDINGSRPLAEIVEEITELVSFKLRGVPCWCQIADGAQLGNCPPKLDALRIVQQPIPAHTGPALGTIFAAFDPLTKTDAKELEALSMAIGLAALAIETRRLYTDLLRRSEFDLLTDIHNRFSLDKHLDALIEEARLKAGVFGLIYIDLNHFKQVNDRFGHQVGDLYLQEVALRLKHQLRSHDMLARLGGDEFAVLLPQVHNCVEVEVIALRLEHCFKEPFVVDNHVLHGSASLGWALYPEDGATKDALLSAADVAMYMAKHSRREAPPISAEKKQPELTRKDHP